MVLWPGDQRAWHDSAMWLSSTSSSPKKPRHLGLVETADLCCLSDCAEANQREENLVRAKPTFVSRLTMVWAALTRLVLWSLSFISRDRACAGCSAFPENLSQGMWGNLQDLVCFTVPPLGGLGGSGLCTPRANQESRDTTAANPAVFGGAVGMLQH